MIEITSQDLTVVSGAGDVNWVQVGRDVVTTGAVIAGGAFGSGIGGPVVKCKVLSSPQTAVEKLKRILANQHPASEHNS